MTKEKALLFTLVSMSFLLVLFSLILNFSLVHNHSSITGKAISEEGEVSVHLINQLSITTDDDNTIVFSGCYPNNTIYSDTIEGNGSGACPGFTSDGIYVRNNGDVDVNVSVSFSNWGEAHGGTFLNSTTNTSWIAYKMSNATLGNYSGGCSLNLQDSWQNITSSSLLPVCDTLLWGEENTTMRFDIGLFIPENITASTNELIINFLAELA